MRDILITMIVFGSLPFMFKRPYLGIIMWVWIGVMSPHTQSWGFATSFPFAAIIAGTTFLAMMFGKGTHTLPRNGFTWMLLAFTFWMCVTTVFAFEPGNSFDMWSRVMKIMLMTFVALALINTKNQIHYFIWTLFISLGYYGIKGGIFTIRSGGAYMVSGPANTFIGGNNELALALVVLIPIIRYLQMNATNKWVRHGLTASMLLCALAALGSYSRGALLAMAAMSLVLWMKSKQKLKTGLALLLIAPVLLTFMPDRWTARMNTIETYQQDTSAQGRINSWWMTFNLAVDRPLTGGGFAIYDRARFVRYAADPNPAIILVAHSIYFQALGEHGFVGLALYLMLGFLTWKNGTWVMRHTAGRDDLKWAHDLATMIQVSLAGFAVGGAFLSLLYFDVPYYLMVAMVSVRMLVDQETRKNTVVGTRKRGVRNARVASQPAPT